jgi:hypothetical protein
MDKTSGNDREERALTAIPDDPRTDDSPPPAVEGTVRTVGRRSQPPAGVPRAPAPEEQDWVRRMSAYCTRVPKGVFRYASAEEANADWDRWRAALLAEGTGIDRFGDER